MLLLRIRELFPQLPGKRENLVEGWNVHDIHISPPMALAILHAYFVEVDMGLLARLIACSIQDDCPTYNRLFITMCAIWVVDHVHKNEPTRCQQDNCFACTDTPLCFGELFPFSGLEKALRPHFDDINTLAVDLMLSQAAASLTFSSRTGSVREVLRTLYKAQCEEESHSARIGEISVNTGLSKIGAVLVLGEELDLDLLTLVSPQGALKTKKKHHLDGSLYKDSYIMDVLCDFTGEECDLQEIRLPYPAAEPTWGTVPARSDEMKRFVSETEAVPVGRWGSFRRLWQEGMYHLTLSPLGLHVSKFPHREGGITLWQFGVTAGASTGHVDLRNLRKLSEGAYGPSIIEDLIEHHELGNIQIPITSYSCFARDRENNGEPRVQSLSPVNLQESKRFATDGKKLWYNVCGETYVRCVRIRGQWTFLYEETCRRSKRFIHVQPKRRMIISALWAH